MAEAADISVVIPTYRRPERLLQTLRELSSCDPSPAEIIVHVDAGDSDTSVVLEQWFPDVRVLTSETRQGPGGARNRLLAAARCPVVVSLDDDSFPMDVDFFVSVQACFDSHPQMGVLAMVIQNDGEPEPPRRTHEQEVADFGGGGCAYRRSAFLETSGYLPLHPAYGMEETDLSLQLLDRGWSILLSGELRVRHASDRANQASPSVVAAHVCNTLLLAYLRYPIRHAGLALAQFANRVLYSVRRGHWRGALIGIVQVPATLFRHRHQRQTVRSETIRRSRSLRRNVMAAPE